MIVVVAVVGLLLVVSFLAVLSLETGLTGVRTPPIPLAIAFAAGNPIEGTCPSGSTFLTSGCAAGDAEYTLTIEASTVAFGDVAFEVLTPAGSVVSGTGGLGFTVLNLSGVVLAQFAAPGGQMSMSSAAWTYASGTTSSTPLLYTDSIAIDIGTIDPMGQGFYFAATGVGQYTGTAVGPALP